MGKNQLQLWKSSISAHELPFPKIYPNPRPKNIPVNAEKAHRRHFVAKWEHLLLHCHADGFQKLPHLSSVLEMMDFIRKITLNEFTSVNLDVVSE